MVTFPIRTLSDATAAQGGQSIIPTLVIIAAFGLMFYFMIYKPQKKQEKQILDMRSNLKVGDEISTNGGLMGKIVQIKDDFIILENGADRTKIKIAKWAVRSVDVSVDADDDEDEDDE